MVGFFYDKITVEAKGTKWADAEKQNLGLTSNNVILSFVSGTGPVEFSFNGTDLHGEIGASGQPDSITLNAYKTNEIWLRGAVGDEEVQIWAWV